jgi:hypothetical protein
VGQAFRRRDATGFVPLKAAYLRRFFPGPLIYKAVVDALKASGALLCDGRYARGSKSLGFKLGGGLQAMTPKRFPIVDRRLLTKLVGYRNSERELGITLPVHRHLQCVLANVRIDYEPAMAALLQRRHSPSDQTALEMIRHGDFRLTVDEFGHRVHTNLTSLRAIMRPFLSVRGQQLVNVDLACSQPLLFSLRLRRHYRGNLEADVRQYIALCEQGVLYDTLMAGWGIPARKRHRFKRSFFASILYCQNEPVRKRARQFGEMFPNVLAAIHALKADDYKDLPRRLQRAESELVIGTIATRFMREHPHAFLGTLHDSLLVTPDYARYARAIMAEEFNRAGLNPTLKSHKLWEQRTR